VRDNKSWQEEVELESRQQWDQVSSNPEKSKMQVLRSGILANGIGVMPAGGHIEPTSIAGESAKCM